MITILFNPSITILFNPSITKIEKEENELRHLVLLL